MMLTWMVSVAGTVWELVYEIEIHVEEVRGRLVSENKFFLLKCTEVENMNFEVLLCTHNAVGFVFTCFLWAVGCSSNCQIRFIILSINSLSVQILSLRQKAIIQ